MRPTRARRSAFTLVEILVTTMVMLIMVLAMSQMFALMGRHVGDARAVIEIQGALRTAGFRLQEDLDGMTIVGRQSPELDWELGYFEYIEGADDTTNASDGIGSDFNPRFGVNSPPLGGTYTAYGDIDDAIAFTARSSGRPFIGRIRRSILTGNPAHNGETVNIESSYAEMIYWTDWIDSNANTEVDLGEVSLHRRVLLIIPELNPVNMPSAGTIRPNDLLAFYNQSDLSIHLEIVDLGGSRVVRLTPNKLTDLALRDNRVAHLPSANVVAGSYPATPVNEPRPFKTLFPNLFSRAGLPRHFTDTAAGLSAVIGPTGNRLGEDVVQTDLLAFDVRAYDPAAPLRQYFSSNNPVGDLLRPGDYGWGGATEVGKGAYVDLGYAYSGAATSPAPWFNGVPSTKSGLAGSVSNLIVPTYDTWTLAYERDGFDQDDGGSSLADEANNGVDDDSVNGVDDSGERETTPPYFRPLRGLQITLRVIELDTRQVRQSTIVSKFMPE